MTTESSYPAALDGDLQALVPTVTPDGAGDFFKRIADAVSNIETELGINPSGAGTTGVNATVAAAIAGIRSDITALQEGGGGGGGGGGGRTGRAIADAVAGVIDLSDATKASFLSNVGGSGDKTLLMPDHTTAGMFMFYVTGAGGGETTYAATEDGDSVDIETGPTGIASGWNLFWPTYNGWGCVSFSNIDNGSVSIDLSGYVTLAQLATAVTIINRTYVEDDYTMTSSDVASVIEFGGAADQVLTVDAESSKGWVFGNVVEIAQVGTGGVSVAPAGGVTIRSAGDLVTLGGQWSSATLRYRGGDEWLLTGLLV